MPLTYVPYDEQGCGIVLTELSAMNFWLADK